jgi:4-hydroxyphenylpyruvate dioxygenase
MGLVVGILYTEISVEPEHAGICRSFLTALSYRPGQDTAAVPEQQPGTWLVRGTSCIRLALASGDGQSAARHVARHGDGVSDVAFLVTSVAQACDRAMAAGAELLREPRPCALEDIAAFAGAADARQAYRRTLCERLPVTAVIGTPYGIQHTLYEIPGYRVPDDPALETTDHVALAVGRGGELEAAARFYSDGLGFGRQTMEPVVVGEEGLDSCVLTGGAAVITVVAPLEGGASGQIDSFLKSNNGPGIQHVALRVGDVVREVCQARKGGVPFLKPSPGYYDWLRPRVEQAVYSPARMAELQRAGVLVGTEGPGRHIEQIFTGLCVGPLFWELIRRDPGAAGFGLDNVEYLFKAKRQADAAVNTGASDPIGEPDMR